MFLYLPGGKILYLKISVQAVVLKEKILNTESLMSKFRSKVPPPLQKFPLCPLANGSQHQQKGSHEEINYCMTFINAKTKKLFLILCKFEQEILINEIIFGAYTNHMHA